MALQYAIMMLSVIFSLGVQAAPGADTQLVARDPNENLAIWCFNECKGVSRLEASLAANAMCRFWNGKLMKVDGDNSDGYGFSYTYDSGSILMSVKPFWEELGCGRPGDPILENDFFKDNKRCYYALMAPIDKCDTSGTGNKQGGHTWEYCTDVTIDPNPQGCSSNKHIVLSQLTASDAASVFHYNGSAEVRAAEAAVARGDLDPSNEDQVITFSQATAKTKPSKVSTHDFTTVNADSKCFDDCHIVTGAVAHEAMGWFCKKNDGRKLFDRPDAFSDETSPNSAAENFAYNPEIIGHSSTVQEQGIVALAIDFDFNSEDEQCQHSTFENFTISYDSCMSGFANAVDRCTPTGERNKQGGVWLETCISFMVDPAPDCENSL